MDLKKLKESTEIGHSIEMIEEFYSCLDNDLELFAKKHEIKCKAGCGTCCEHYIPEMTQLEALYLAYDIIQHDRTDEVLARLDSYDKSTGICPLYNKEGPFHCSVYSSRALICRLFGASCFINKDGKGVFHHCKWNDDQKNLADEEINNENPPIMGKYGRAIESLDDNSTQKEDIDIALPKAINKIQLYMSLLDDKAWL